MNLRQRRDCQRFLRQTRPADARIVLTAIAFAIAITVAAIGLSVFART